MKICELCDSLATIFCESDQARLCWDCDSKVHSANFLVAKHTRTVLCHLCQSPTPWTGSGPKLTPTATFCALCESGNNSRWESESTINNEEEDEDVDDEIDGGGDDDEENQVVPWAVSSSASTSTSASLRGPPQVSSSSNGTDQECSSWLFNGHQGASVSRRGFPLK